MLVEDFEDTNYIFTITSAGGWARNNSRAKTGSWSYKSAAISHNATADAVITVPAGALTVRFWYTVDSEPGYDFFRFKVGSTQQLEASGNVDWTQTPEYPLGAATQITFSYSKDGSGSNGADAVWVDDVTFTMPLPHLVQPPRSVAALHRASRW
ncbi:hypothetical protein [Streptosporangium sp. NPDC051022]|uniref:hypothetical protein n=1 Tax=Streptosporangium sp. NPDC051022 TaxID=3155752 RepID=UPI00344AD713